MLAFRLPVSGQEVVLREPSGAEDLLLHEAGAESARVAVALIGCLSRGPGGEPLDVASWTVTDLDAALLRLRQTVAGDRIVAEVRCTGAECETRIDITLRISDYLAQYLPEKTRGAAPLDGEPGWFRLDGAEVSFRLPTAGDQIAVATEPDPLRALMARCVRPASISSRILRRVESLMDALAPALQNELQGACPECGAAVSARFDPRRYVLAELTAQASTLYEEIHQVAARYHWSEPDILALSRRRRMEYAERIRAEGRAA